MDPVANLQEQRELAASILDDVDRLERLDIGHLDTGDVARLAELVQALDEWRTTGGFDPYATNPRGAVI